MRPEPVLTPDAHADVLRLLISLITVIGFLLGAITGCTCGSSSSSNGATLPIAKSGPKSWAIDGKQYPVASTYYLALPEGFQFTVEFEVPPGTNPNTLTDTEAYDLAFPLMRHATKNRLYDTKIVSKVGSGTVAVSRIGVVLFAQSAAGTRGYRVARTLEEIENRMGRQPRTQPEAAADRTTKFSLKNAGTTQLLFLMGMVLAFGTTVAAVVTWIRGRRTLPRKWLWLAAIITGIGKLGFDWTTRQVLFAPLSVQLFSVGALRESGATSWMMFLSLPLGALAFLLRKPGRTNDEQSIGRGSEAR